MRQDEPGEGDSPTSMPQPMPRHEPMLSPMPPARTSDGCTPTASFNRSLCEERVGNCDATTRSRRIARRNKSPPRKASPFEPLEPTANNASFYLAISPSGPLRVIRPRSLSSVNATVMPSRCKTSTRIRDRGHSAAQQTTCRQTAVCVPSGMRLSAT